MSAEGRLHGAEDLTTIIPGLAENQHHAEHVLDLYADGDLFILMEGCDGYYGATLTADQVRRFALWLLEWIGDGAQPAEPPVSPGPSSSTP